MLNSIKRCNMCYNLFLFIIFLLIKLRAPYFSKAIEVQSPNQYSILTTQSKQKAKYRIFLVQSAKISSFFEIRQISRRTSRRGSSCRRRDDETTATATTARDERGLRTRARDPETRIAWPQPHKKSLENRRWHHGRSISPEINIPYIDIPPRPPGTRVAATATAVVVVAVAADKYYYRIFRLLSD